MAEPPAAWTFDAMRAPRAGGEVVATAETLEGGKKAKAPPPFQKIDDDDDD